MNKDNIHSPEVSHVMGRALPGTLKWGWGIVLALFLTILAGGWFTHYPLVETYPIVLSPTDSFSQEKDGMIRIDASDSGKFFPGQEVWVEPENILGREGGKIKGKVGSVTLCGDSLKCDVRVIFSPGTLKNVPGKDVSKWNCIVVVGQDRLIKKILPGLHWEGGKHRII